MLSMLNCEIQIYETQQKLFKNQILHFSELKQHIIQI